MKDRLGQKEDRQDQRRVADRQPHPHAGGAAHLGLLAGGGGGGDHRHHRVGVARAEGEEGKEHLRAQRAGGKVDHPVPAQHDRVGHVQRELRQVAANERQAQRQQGAGIGTEAKIGRGGRERHDGTCGRIG
jgi:hypothetical protein